MKIFVQMLHLLFWGVGASLSVLVGYLVLLTGAAWFAPGRTPRRTLGADGAGTPRHRFLFLVPAHNEELLLPRLLANLHRLDYPEELYQVHAVADNCSDQTAELGRRGGATVHERTDTVRIGKGYALQWLLSRIREAAIPYDAAVILDADSVVSENFLRVMDAQLSNGARVVQAYYAVLDAERSWAVSLRSSALAVLHYLRPQGRMVLGGSVGLKGNGMVFSREILETHQWSASVTEDIEYHMTLLLAGERVLFAPDATVWADMPAALQNSQTQNVRWEQGRMEMARQYIPRLLRAMVHRPGSAQRASTFMLADAVLEHIIPPFSILAGITLFYLLLAALWYTLFDTIGGLVVAVLVLLGQVVYLVSGMVMTRAPRRVYLAMLYMPFFAAWKIWLYVRVLLRVERQGWVRTARDEA